MNGILVSFLVGACTGIGALPFLFVKKVPLAIKDGLLGFAAGIMIFASSFNLLETAMKDGDIFNIVGGIVVGAFVLTFIEYFVPHTHAEDYHKSNKTNIKKNFLLAVAVAIHNIPEGFAVGVGYGSGNVVTGINLALAIGIQNIPEGLVVAAPLIDAGYSKSKVILFSFLTGIGEPIAAIIGLYTVKIISNLLPFIFSFAAGAMFYVVSHELIPESHCNNNEIVATYGFMGGLILMIIFKTFIDG
ncbi:ZIP family metal transporter [Thermohalobacter berrensis]|uniref:Protein gufA n=1 Tax=Thermohalobacter berrensis TaxID=99594 RepID=A0A419SV16_9FIRM|nr:ZIP family metal transporter [Thermohalobacter berrensis]RKD29072.1 hypothetical protein BET03_05860 [Thermohalobacter berrensis]